MGTFGWLTVLVLGGALAYEVHEKNKLARDASGANDLLPRPLPANPSQDPRVLGSVMVELGYLGYQTAGVDTMGALRAYASTHRLADPAGGDAAFAAAALAVDDQYRATRNLPAAAAATTS